MPEAHAELQRRAATVGAERERRRIRRAIMYPRNALVRLACGGGMEALGPTLRGLVEIIDAATRAPRKGKRK
jgi:hypothetical protein